MQVQPLTPSFGAVIERADVVGMTDAQFTELFDHFTEWSVIFLRDQPALTPEQHLEFAQRFGDIHVHPAARGKPAEFPGLMRMKTNKESRVAAGNRWHRRQGAARVPV